MISVWMLGTHQGVSLDRDSSPSQRGWGSAVSSPSGVRGGAPVVSHFRLKRKHLVLCQKQLFIAKEIILFPVRSGTQPGNEQADLELGPEANWEPMKLVSNAGRDVRELVGILKMIRFAAAFSDGLETVELKPAGTAEDAVAIVDPIADEAVRKHEDRFLSKTVANRAQTTQLEKTGTT